MVEALWPYVVRFIGSALERSASDFTIERIKQKIDSGQSYLWIIWDGELLAAGTTELNALENGRKLCVITTWAGKDMENWDHLFGQLEDYARAEGCAAMRICGRQGWARRLKARGWRQPYIVLEKIV